ncbi:polyketide synthase [Purpureocillium lavendulum]|uniref:Polyketide synthase n=1 Tax=Purpureocillium lavendulum TaxID=1247861 RepID=A0AB34G171_9HYPO|nr:polyketide synthase [Purpureocillium lavendulum]
MTHTSGQASSTWHFSSHDELEILSLAAWCQAKQQQREPIQSSRDADDDGLSDSSEATDRSSSSINTQLLARDGTMPTKEYFLDHLAEILCFEKSPSFIASTAMMEQDDMVTIVAARNGASWTKRDSEILEYLATFMEKWSRSDVFDEDPAPILQAKLADYYTPRLRYHVRELIKHEAGKTHLPFFDKACPDFLSESMPAYDFVKIVEELSFRTDFYSALKARLPPAMLERVVKEDLAFIGRPMEASTAFARAAQEIGGFQRVRVQLLGSYRPKRLQCVPPLPNGDTPVSKKLREKYSTEIRKPKWVHAEMRVMSHLLSKEMEANCVPYLGASKKTCFLCGSMIRQMGHFQTRPNHGKVYSQWTLPSIAVAGKADIARMQEAVKQLRVALKQEVTRTELQHMKLEKESVMAAPIPPPPRKRTLFNNYVQDPRLQDRESTYFNLLAKREKELESSADWAAHKFRCSLGRPIDAADYLVRACQDDRMPEDEETAAAYGFLHLVSAHDRLRLLDIYRCFVNQYGVGDDELRQAWQRDLLKEFLTFRLMQLPPEEFSSDLEWLRQQDGFRAGSVCNLVEKSLAAARMYLSPEDKNVPLYDLEPREKQQALVFYGQILHGYVPDSDEDNWMSLGFCTAKDSHGISLLRNLYASLVRKCNFDEFWLAMAGSSMMNLLEKHDLRREIVEMRNFEHFMRTAATSYESVWELKRFTRQPHSHPMRAVQVDYGFMKCDTAEKRAALRNVYGRYFSSGGDELKLHEACVSGRLTGFLQSVLGKLEVADDVFKGPYPLERCSFMGLVFVKDPVICIESSEEMVRNVLKKDGRTCPIMTIPDVYDARMKQVVEERAAFLNIGMSKRVTPRGNKTVIELKTE